MTTVPSTSATSPSISSLIKTNIGISIELSPNKAGFHFYLAHDESYHGDFRLLTKEALHDYAMELVALSNTMESKPRRGS